MTSELMTSEHGAVAWRVIAGTARGSAHHARHMPNQDAVGSVSESVTTIVAVADGHGHARHARSATGSRLAVRVACRAGAQFAAALSGHPAEAEAGAGIAAIARELLPRAIVGDWRAEVATHLAANPYTAREQAALAAGDRSEVPYGSTLLVAVRAGSWLVCAQIGDGDMLVVRPDGTASRPVAGDSRLDGQHTTSLCQQDAAESFRVGVHDLGALAVLSLLLATDGYGNAQAAEDWEPEVARDLAAFAAEHDHCWFAQQLPAWAQRCASTEGSGDDTTIALLMPANSTELAASARRESAHSSGQ